ncbi:unnamed protein product [Rhizophagus irregularis]|nr:unnamed protein product [Rhizophagus irregularis]
MLITFDILRQTFAVPLHVMRFITQLINIKSAYLQISDSSSSTISIHSLIKFLHSQDTLNWSSSCCS